MRGRPRSFARHELPYTVVGICVAVIADYNRREKEIRKGTLTEPLLSSYQKYNDIVNKAAMCIEDGNKSEFISDIETGRGYRHSRLAGEYTSWSYYARKRDFIYKVAAGLGFCECNE